MSGAPTAALRVERVSKRFAAVRALSDVSVSFMPGIVTAVLGENGAGKSTLIRICSGEHLPDEGRLLADGEPLVLRTPIEANRNGIAVVHQEPQLVGEASVAENIFLSRLGDTSALRPHHRRALVAEARALLEDLELTAELPDPARPCRDLSAAERQLVEIARALATRPRVLFLDEPNSSLTRRETDRLFAIVRRLRDEGVAVVLVSHRLGEVYEISDRIVILRDGQHVGEGTPEEIPIARAIELMAGKRLEAAERVDAPPAPRGREVLRLRGLTGERFRDVDFVVHAGEIVGMAGLVGAGRTEIAQAVVGLDPIVSGTVEVHGRPVRITSTQAALDAGISFISEERRTSVFHGQTVAFNLTASIVERFGRFGFYRHRAERRYAREKVAEHGVKTASVDAPIASLSGGNQQKVLIARALASEPALIVLDEPTRGVDVGTKAEIYRMLRTLAHERGLAVWFISSEMDEILSLADRIVVVHDGRIVDDLPRGPEAATVVAAALGERVENAGAALLSTDSSGGHS